MRASDNILPVIRYEAATKAKKYAKKNCRSKSSTVKIILVVQHKCQSSSSTNTNRMNNIGTNTKPASTRGKLIKIFPTEEIDAPEDSRRQKEKAQT